MDRTVLTAYGWPDLEVPPFCPKTPADRTALQTFEDTVIDRLYVLNAERGREEERLGLGGTKGKAGRARKATKPKQEQKAVPEAQTSLAIERESE